MKSKLVFFASRWEDDEFIISARPESDEVWKDVPIGGTLLERDAWIIKDWLNVNFPELLKLENEQ
jgi:hypothetical protein